MVLLLLYILAILLFFFEIVCQAQVGVTKPRQQTAPGSSKETASTGKKTVLQHRLSWKV